MSMWPWWWQDVLLHHDWVSFGSIPFLVSQTLLHAETFSSCFLGGNDTSLSHNLHDPDAKKLKLFL
jgi:hypothetical protein